MTREVFVLALLGAMLVTATIGVTTIVQLISELLITLKEINRRHIVDERYFMARSGICGQSILLFVLSSHTIISVIAFLIPEDDRNSPTRALLFLLWMLITIGITLAARYTQRNWYRALDIVESRNAKKDVKET